MSSSKLTRKVTVIKKIWLLKIAGQTGRNGFHLKVSEGVGKNIANASSKTSNVLFLREHLDGNDAWNSII